MMTSTDLIRYYAERAPEYEKIYHKPERQSDLGLLHEIVRRAFTGQHVLEIACGTGYWTETLGRCAASVTATDINEEVLEIARAKPVITRSGVVKFRRVDAYTLEGVDPCSAALVAFWWSHIPKERMRSFLEILRSRLRPGSTFVFMDNRPVAGSSTPISRTDQEGNTYQLRTLEDGSSHEVLKNFPTVSDLREAVAFFAPMVTIELLEYYWVLRGQVPLA